MVECSRWLRREMTWSASLQGNEPDDRLIKRTLAADGATGSVAQLQAGSSTATHAIPSESISTTAAQPWPLMDPAARPAVGHQRPVTPAFEGLVCEVTLALWPSEGPTSDSSLLATRGRTRVQTLAGTA